MPTLFLVEHAMKVILYLAMLILLQLPCLAAQEISPDLATQIEQGDNFLGDDNVDQAIQIYRQAVKAFPNSSQAHERLGKALSLAGQLADAKRADQKAIELDPLNARAHGNLGWILGMQKKYHQAIQEERIAIHLDPSIASSHLTLALALASIGNYDAALEANREAIRLEPENVKAYINHAATLGRRGNYPEAIETYNMALQLNPDSVAAHLGMGAAYGKMGRLKDQIKEFQTAVTLAPHSDNAHGKLGWALYKAGDWDAAVREGCVTNWLRLSKSGPQYLQNVVGLWGGIFILFGLIFAAIFFSCHFKPLNGEIVDKSYFLIFHKDKPGRFIITNKRYVFVPEAFSAWFGSKQLSIDIDQVAKIQPITSGKSGVEIVGTDGNSYQFTMPPLVAEPLFQNLTQHDSSKLS